MLHFEKWFQTRTRPFQVYIIPRTKFTTLFLIRQIGMDEFALWWNRHIWQKWRWSWWQFEQLVDASIGIMPFEVLQFQEQGSIWPHCIAHGNWQYIKSQGSPQTSMIIDLSPSETLLVVGFLESVSPQNGNALKFVMEDLLIYIQYQLCRFAQFAQVHENHIFY